MSVQSRLNLHRSGWRRGMPRPQAIVRTTKGKPSAPRFTNPPAPAAPARDEICTLDGVNIYRSPSGIVWMGPASVDIDSDGSPRRSDRPKRAPK